MNSKTKIFAIRSIYMTAIIVIFTLLFKYEGIRNLMFFYWIPGEDFGLSLNAILRMLIYILVLFVLMFVMKAPMRIMLSYNLLDKNKNLSFKDAINTSLKFKKNRSKGDTNFISTFGEIFVLILSIIVDTFNWFVSVVVSIGSTLIAAALGASTTLVAGSFMMIIIAIIPIALIFGLIFGILLLTWTFAPFFIPFFVLGLVNKIVNNLMYQMFDINEEWFTNKDETMLNVNRKSKIIGYVILSIPFMMLTGLLPVIDNFDSVTLSVISTMLYGGGLVISYSVFSIPFIAWEYKIYNRIIDRKKYDTPAVIEAEVKEIK